MRPYRHCIIIGFQGLVLRTGEARLLGACAGPVVDRISKGVSITNNKHIIGNNRL
jgi:hypothetical protein